MVFSQNAPITIADNVSGNETLIILPISVTNFVNIGSCDLQLFYDPSIVTATAINKTPVLIGMISSNLATPGVISWNWFKTQPNGLSLPDNTVIFNITFTKVTSTGSTALTWNDDGYSCVWYNSNWQELNDIPTSTYYINGSIGNGIILDLKIFLEGPFINGEMSKSLNNLDVIPHLQPFTGYPWNYNGTEWAVNIPIDAVDWVLVDLRESNGDAYSATPDKSIGKKAGFVMKNGSIKEIDGIQNIRILVNPEDNIYAVVFHRNHLPVISANPLININGTCIFDFSSGELQALGGNIAHKQLSNNAWGLIAGDGDANFTINVSDHNDLWSIQAGRFGYFAGDFNLNGQVDNSDKNDFWVINNGFNSQVPQ
jgi:hypothetical protein